MFKNVKEQTKYKNVKEQWESKSNRFEGFTSQSYQ